MDCPELYFRDNGMQRSGAKDVLSKCIEKMIWKSNEIVLDIGCGPGDVTFDILYPFIKNKIKQLVGVDKSKQMVEYAQKTFRCTKIDFKILDIENANDCTSYTYSFDKIFSFFCFHWVCNQFDALVNMHSMLKSGGEILVYFLLTNPIFELYKYMDAEWKTYIDSIQTMQTLHSQEEVKAVFIKAGFRIINVDSSIKSHTFPDLTSVLNAVKPVDDMYNILPPHLHDKYSIHVKEKICERKLLNICPDTGKATNSYLPITVHAIKD